MKTLDTETLAIDLGAKKGLVSEEHYNEMLRDVSPERIAHGGFLFGEPQDHDGPNQTPHHRCYFIDKKRYYDGGLMTVDKFEGYLKDEVINRGRVEMR